MSEHWQFPPPPGLCTAAVVIPTVRRPSLARAVQSVFDQDLDGTIHVLIGVDTALGGEDVLREIEAARPDNVYVTLLDPGYSTSQRHGGLTAAKDGGALRTVLSYMAHSRFVAYLDDDNWLASDHLSALVSAIDGKAWAFTRRWFSDPKTLQSYCEDDWESIGPGHGIFEEKFGGWSDPNTLMIDKTVCEAVLRLWSVPLSGDPSQLTADRHVFHALKKNFRWGDTGRPTVHYAPNTMDPIHPRRWAEIQARLRA